MSQLVGNENAALATGLDPDVINILGEVLWHTTTSDPSIVQVSHEHMREIERYAEKHLPVLIRQPVRFLEVASYAHITGYLLAQNRGWIVTLSDISVQTLALGALQAQVNQLDPNLVRRVASDFHDLPFSDGSFDIVYIASALHHTLRWQKVLKELQRVTAPGGLLIFQNEPCQRHFCFYKFPTNRPDSFRPVEAELYKLDILKTIAEPYLGSRPETLFGMIENQQMPLLDILEILKSEGALENLNIDSSICMSELDKSILAAPRNIERNTLMIKNELIARLDKSHNLLTETDKSLGYCFPTLAEVTEMALSVAHRLSALPEPGSQLYKIAVADIFGGSITAVLRKFTSTTTTVFTDQLRFSNGNRNGVLIGYPPRLNNVLESAHDLVPDIQTAESDDISRSFPTNEWRLDSNDDLRYLVLTNQTGHIKLREQPSENSRFLVLLRVYGSPISGAPFRIQLFVNQEELSGVDVYQADSFLLHGELTTSSNTNLFVRIVDLNHRPMEIVPPVTVAAVRVLWISSI